MKNNELRENGKKGGRPLSYITYNTKEYYASEQDYYLDHDNVADCKYQVRLSEESFLYAIGPDEDQFFISKIGKEDVFYVGRVAKNYVASYQRSHGKYNQ
jgi:hypothetical protein